MFSFFKKLLGQTPAPPPPPEPAAEAAPPPRPAEPAAPATPPGAAAPAPAPAPVAPAQPPVKPAAAPAPAPAPAPLPPTPAPSGGSLIGSALVQPIQIPVPAPVAPERQRWLDKLSAGLRKTGSSISLVFTGAQIDDNLYEELESALLMADTGVKATQHLLDEVKRRVQASGATRPVQVKNILIDSLTQLLKPLEKPLVIGQYTPTVIMVAGVNGAGKTTSIGKLTKHLANEGASVLLAAADTFRAAAREQLAIWADRNTVEIVSQEGGDPAAVSFDAVTAGRARGKDVVLVDTAGRLPTQLHLMEELRKIKRVRGVGEGRIFLYATLPQVLPQLLSYVLYRWENNIRAAAVLGVVGAGGLGQLLAFHMGLFQMAETSSVLAAMLVLVLLVDVLSYGARRTMSR